VHGDGGDERNIGPVIGYCSTEQRARELARKRGWYGSDGYVMTVNAVCIEGKTYVLAQPGPIEVDRRCAELDAKLREETVASLTQEQLRVLGVRGV